MLYSNICAVTVLDYMKIDSATHIHGYCNNFLLHHIPDFSTVKA